MNSYTQNKSQLNPNAILEKLNVLLKTSSTETCLSEIFDKNKYEIVLKKLCNCIKIEKQDNNIESLILELTLFILENFVMNKTETREIVSPSTQVSATKPNKTLSRGATSASSLTSSTSNHSLSLSSVSSLKASSSTNIKQTKNQNLTKSVLNSNLPKFNHSSSEKPNRVPKQTPKSTVQPKTDTEKANLHLTSSSQIQKSDSKSSLKTKSSKRGNNTDGNKT